MRSFEIDDQQIGRRIFFARHDKHLSCEELARQTGLSVSFIRNIERGSKRCSLDSLVRICSVLELSADYALFGKDAESERIAIVCDYLEHQLEDLKHSQYDPRFLK